MKLKTSKTARKRVLKITKSGKILHRNLSAQHLTLGKSKRVLRGSNKTSILASAQTKKIKQMIGL